MTTAPLQPAADSRPASRRGRIIAIVAALVTIGLAVAALALAGPITDLLRKQHRETFATYADAERGWSGVPIPAWVPGDATDLRNAATTNETTSVILLDSAAAEPVGCTTAPRHGMPAITSDWMRTPPKMPDTVWACGPYEVMRVDGGFLGWFQAETEGATPETQHRP